MGMSGFNEIIRPYTLLWLGLGVLIGVGFFCALQEPTSRAQVHRDRRDSRRACGGL